MSSNPLLDRLTDQALLDQFGDLVQQGHHHTAALLRHIDVIDRRKLWAKYGHPSLFDFCVSRHHMSESTAAKRIGAARAARRFPVLFEMVGRGELHLSGIHRLKAHLTPGNHQSILGQAKHRTLREIDVLVARLAPKPDVPATLRALPERRAPTIRVAPDAAASPPFGLAGATPARSATSTLVEPCGPRMPAPPTLPVTVARIEPPGPQVALVRPFERRAPDPMPLSPGRYKLTVTLDEQSHRKLEQLQDLLAHKIPNGDPAAIVARALEALLKAVHKRKTGSTDRPRAPKPAPSAEQTRHLQAAVRREVWPSEGARCGFVGEDGHRCNETRGLQFAHKVPWAKGGANTAENLGLRCILCRMRHKGHYAEYGFMPPRGGKSPRNAGTWTGHGGTCAA